MKRFNLPARVRVSELQNLPGETVLNQLKKLEPGQAHTLENLQLEPGRVRMAVALAGGSPIGYAVQVDGVLSVVVPASWQGKGIEAALEGTLELAVLERGKENSGETISSSEFVLRGAQAEIPNKTESGET